MMSGVSTFKMKIIIGKFSIGHISLSVPPKSGYRKRRSCFTELISCGQVNFFITLTACALTVPDIQTAATAIVPKKLFLLKKLFILLILFYFMFP